MASKIKIVYVIGTRPEIIRSARVINLLRKDKDIDFRLVHTGQHYDYAMSGSFFKELGLGAPDKQFSAGSGGHGAQTGKMLADLEMFFQEFIPDVVIVFGDTNSSLAAALAATKLHIPIAHLEAGCREWDMSLPEEVNRRLIDHCSDLLFAVSEASVKNLKDERVLGAIYNTGDPLYDIFQTNIATSKKLQLTNKLGLKTGEYILLTTHRAGSVDNPLHFKNILEALNVIKKYRVVFPIHPRAKNQLEKLNYPREKLSNFLIIDPLQHQEILHLISNARLVVTDSGGLQKEVFWAKVPCITLRDITAWSETVDLGVNFLTETDKKKIIGTIKYIDKNHDRIKKMFIKIKDPYHKPQTAEKTIALIKKFYYRHHSK